MDLCWQSDVSALLYTLSRFVIAFLPKIKCLSWLQSPSHWFWNPKKTVCYYFHFSPSICHDMIGLDAMMFIYECWILISHLPKGLYSQSYGFSSSHIQTWELDQKEGWVPKNWYFRIVVLEKTLKIPLDSKEIKLVLKEISPEYSLEGLTLKL